jgi:hypothetical protein
MNERIVPTLTVILNLITKLIWDWDGENSVELLGNAVRNGDFRSTHVNHWKPILLRCEEYLKGVSEEYMENLRQTEKRIMFKEDIKKKVLKVIEFLAEVKDRQGCNHLSF